MTEEKKNEESVKDEFTFVKIPTGEDLGFQSPKGEVYDLHSMVLDLANRLYKVEKLM